MRKDACIHSRSPFMHKTCRKGINFKNLLDTDSDVGLGNKVPCYLENNSKVVCQHFQLPTQDETDQYEKEQAERFARIIKAMTAIDGHLGPFKKGKSPSVCGVIECPNCGGRLSYSRASINGHVHGKCSTTGCCSWMQ